MTMTHMDGCLFRVPFLGLKGSRKRKPKPFVGSACLCAPAKARAQQTRREVQKWIASGKWVLASKQKRTQSVAKFHLAAQKTGVPKMGCPGKWKHGPKPAVCPSDRLILSHAHLSFRWFGLVDWRFGGGFPLSLLKSQRFKSPSHQSQAPYKGVSGTCLGFDTRSKPLVQKQSLLTFKTI